MDGSSGLLNDEECLPKFLNLYQADRQITLLD